MKKGMKIGIVVLGIVFLLPLSSALFMKYKYAAETSKMSPLQTGEVVPGVFAVINEGFANFFLVRGAGGYVAFDAGYDLQETEAALKTLGIDPGSVTALFLTHTDSDHTACAGLFRNARVFISRDEEQMVDGTTARAFIFRNKLPLRHELLDDGQVVEIAGLKVQGISTPGHTPGSMCYLVDGKLLFTGDTMSLKNGHAELFNGFFNMDDEKQAEAIRKLAKLRGVRDIFTAHYGHSADFAKTFEGR